MSDQTTGNLSNVPNPSASFGNVPHHAESFGSIPNAAERKEHHILTVRQVARMFEDAGVPRSPHSITNWCHPDKKTGVSRLDAYYDNNTRKWFITPSSVELVIADEKAKANPDSLPHVSEGVPQSSALFPKDSEEVRHTADRGGESENKNNEIEDLRNKLFLAEVGKTAAEQALLQIKEFMQENRSDYKDHLNQLTQQLVNTSKQVGELETRLLQIEAPKQSVPRAQETNSSRIREADILPDDSFSSGQPSPTPAQHS